MRDTWLKIPQAVVLEVTGNLLQARNLEDDDPNLLLIKAILRLPALISIDVDADSKLCDKNTGLPSPPEPKKAFTRMVCERFTPS